MTHNSDGVPDVPRFSPGTGSIILPCGPEQFANFIGNLLGKPQVIQRRFFGSFDIQFEDIENAYHLIEQRLKEQNGAQLIQFSSTFSYSDQSSVTLRGFDEFKLYAEIKYVETVSVSCSFEYLIKFQGRGHPEKQSIDLTFLRDTFALFEDEDTSYFPKNFLRRGQVVIRIEHTARSWGADVEALLTQHVQSYLWKETGREKFLRKYSSACGFVVALIVFLGGLVTLGFATSYLDHSASIGQSNVLASIHDANTASYLGIRYLIERSSLGDKSYFIPVFLFLVLVTGGLAAFAHTFVEGNLSKPRPSFLTFTKADRDRKPIVQRAYKNSKLAALAAAAASLFCGVLGNYIFRLIGIWAGWADLLPETALALR